MVAGHPGPPAMTRHELAGWLEATAHHLGLAAAASLPAYRTTAGEQAAWQAAWGAADNAGRLPWLERTLAARLDPFAGRPWARTVLVFAFPHLWDRPANLPDLPAPAAGAPAGRISRYACGPDYHLAARPLLAELHRRLETRLARPLRHEGGADAWPVPERFLAVRAGLGQTGRNRMLQLAGGRGCRFFLGALFVDAELPAGAWPTPADSATAGAAPPPCAGCRRCLDACPTGALHDDVPLRLAACRSYLSMEYRGVLDACQQGWLGDALFGCDACTAICPPALATPGQAVDLQWLLSVPAGDLRRRLHGTALAHAGPTLLKRNAAAILAGHPGADARRLLVHAAAATGSAVVRDTIAIALAHRRPEA